MPWHALQKRVRGLLSRKRQQSPPSSPSGQPCAAAATGAAELREQVQGRLHRAAACGDLAWLRRWRWYFKRVGIDGRDQQRRTPLHLACANGYADVVRYLARKNCELNLADSFKRTPLMKAVQCQQEECVTILLEYGADPNLADADGNTALHLAVLSGNTAVAGLLLEHNASSDAQNQGGYTPLDLAISKHEEMLECLLKKAADRHAAEQCERTALVVTTRHEADVEEDNLCLQEELERFEAELQEVEEKHLQSERCVRDLKIALEEKERDELATAQNLQDQLLAYLENNITVKRLEEHVQSLAIEKTRLEATVQQQSNRIEALQRDLQASASDSVPELQQQVANAVQEQSTSKDALAVTTSYVADLEKDNLCLQEELARVRAEVGELSQQLDMKSKRCMQLEAENRDSQEELSTLHRKCDELEKSKRQLKEEAAKFQRPLETNTVESSQIKQYEREVEERADQDIREKLQEAQAAHQAALEHLRASHHASLKNQLKYRIRDLERELDKIKNTQQDSTFVKDCAQAEVKKYKELYLEEVKTRQCLTKELERANERLAKAKVKLLRERQRSQSLIRSSTVSGGLAATPVPYSPALGHLDRSLGLDRSLSVGRSFRSPTVNTLSSRNSVAAFVVRREMDEKVTKELKEATAELQTGCAGFQKTFMRTRIPFQ